MLVAAAIAPHGELDGAEATRAAMEEIGRRVADAEPAALVVVTPHNVHVEDHFAVVTAARLGEAPVDRELALAIVVAARADGLPAVAVSFGGNDPAEAEMPIDWGTEVPLAFLPRVPVVVVSPARDRPLAEHVRLGAAIARAAAERAIAVVASADHGHAHSSDGPYGYDAAAAEYDDRVVEAVRANRLGELLAVSELAVRARADSLWQLLVLHGALGDGWRAELLSYEAPDYYGMLCAVFSR